MQPNWREAFGLPIITAMSLYVAVWPCGMPCRQFHTRRINSVPAGESRRSNDVRLRSKYIVNCRDVSFTSGVSHDCASGGTISLLKHMCVIAPSYSTMVRVPVDKHIYALMIGSGHKALIWFVGATCGRPLNTQFAWFLPGERTYRPYYYQRNAATPI